MDVVSKKKKREIIVVSIVALVLVYPSLGQSEESGFSPSLGLTYIHDDNIFREETGGISDDIYRISLGLGTKGSLGKHKLSAQYRGEYNYYDNNTSEDNNNHSLGAALFLDLTPKLNLDLNASGSRAYESRGSSGVTPGVTADQNKIDGRALSTKLIYGRRSAKAQVQLGFGTQETRYVNNNQQDRDRDSDTVSGVVFYNIGPKTSLLFETINVDIDYLNPGARNRDSTERYYHLGLKWDATHKTSGELKIGRFTKDFESASEVDADDRSYAASVVWEPQTYSKVTFGASRQANETTTADSFYTSDVLSVGWDHQFNTRLIFNAGISEGKDDYSGTREDDSYGMALGLKYQFGVVGVAVGYSYSERKSNTADASYEDNIYMLTLSI